MTQDRVKLEYAIWRLYRDFFEMAERKRRWSIRDDIPWSKVNADLRPEVADVMQDLFTAIQIDVCPRLHFQNPACRPQQSRPGLVLRQLGL